METEKLILGYWDLRGRAGLDRTMFAFCGVPFTNKFYSTPVDWFGKEKQEIDLDFPNLPYLIDGDNKVTDSKTIAKYIALKAGRRDLLGLDDDKKFIEIDVAYNAVNDLQYYIIKLVMNKNGDFQTEKTELFEKGAVKTKLDSLSKKLGENEWLTGFASVADVFLFEVLDLIYDMEPAQIENRKNLADFRTRFSALPQIKAHRESEDFRDMWFYPGMTAWNNTPNQ